MRPLLGLLSAQLPATGASVAAQAKAVPATAHEAAPDPHALIAAAINLNRGLASYEMTMPVHRPEWQRRSAFFPSL